MKKTYLVLLLNLLSLSVFSQKIYFIYFQTDNNQSFFVRLNEKVYNSTPSGYLILPKLIDSTYNYEIGLAGKDVSLAFTTAMDKKDHGYLVKNFGEKGWGLFDLQTQQVQMPVNKKTAYEENQVPDATVNAFTELLSRAADDPSLKFSPVVVIEEKKIEPIRPVIIEVKKDTVQTETFTANKIDTAKTVEQKPADKPTVVVKQPPYKKSEVTRIAENNVADGVEIVFADKQTDKTDTITIIIDQPKSTVKTEEPLPEEKADKKFLDIASDSTRVDTAKNEIKSVDKTIKDSPKNTTDSTKTTIAQSLKKIWPFNKDKANSGDNKSCEIVADDNDFLKLRRKMAGRTNDDGMIEEAKKYFKTKCFTTEQTRNLSTMFLSNAGKVNFFEAAYPTTSDKVNFPSLQSELKDEFYINRFQAILQN
jgi:hypothetical protein